MKLLFLSFAVGLGVGVLYGLIRVKSPAPPIVALLGLLGMVLGEQLGIWIQTKKLDVPHAAAVCLVGERYEGAGAKTGGPDSSNLSRLAVGRTRAENDGATRISC